ncbi:MAG TPA: NADP-dependent oxidoreductase [Candidatus Baltobacteraceae bacterium]|jgi:NADPH:quinone reductase-like Zn-dependent oxidoreductase
MKALIVDSYGPPANAKLGTVKPPELKDGYVLVRLHGASVNPYDVKLISGQLKDFAPIEFPYVPGMDGAGAIAGVGEGVEGYRIGDRVVGMFGEAPGTLAEFATIAGDDPKLAHIPDGLDFERAAAIPEAGLTALTIVRAADVHQDQRVLIIGATGGIGLFAIQLAKARGAFVIATAAAADTGYVRTLGADDVIDYAKHDPIAQMNERYPEGIDAVFDLIDHDDKLIAAAGIIRRDGTLVSPLYGPEQSAFPEDVTVRYVMMNARPGDLADLVNRVASGELRVEIAEKYSFDNARHALGDLADPRTHTRGKRVVSIP